MQSVKVMQFSHHVGVQIKAMRLRDAWGRPCWCRKDRSACGMQHRLSESQLRSFSAQRCVTWGWEFREGYRIVVPENGTSSDCQVKTVPHIADSEEKTIPCADGWKQHTVEWRVTWFRRKQYLAQMGENNTQLNEEWHHSGENNTLHRWVKTTHSWMKSDIIQETHRILVWVKALLQKKYVTWFLLLGRGEGGLVLAEAPWWCGLDAADLKFGGLLQYTSTRTPHARTEWLVHALFFYRCGKLDQNWSRMWRVQFFLSWGWCMCSRSGLFPRILTLDASWLFVRVGKRLTFLVGSAVKEALKPLLRQSTQLSAALLFLTVQIADSRMFSIPPSHRSFCVSMWCLQEDCNEHVRKSWIIFFFKESDAKRKKIRTRNMIIWGHSVRCEMWLVDEKNCWL